MAPQPLAAPSRRPGRRARRTPRRRAPRRRPGAAARPPVASAATDGALTAYAGPSSSVTGVARRGWCGSTAPRLPAAVAAARAAAPSSTPPRRAPSRPAGARAAVGRPAPRARPSSPSRVGQDRLGVRRRGRTARHRRRTARPGPDDQGRLPHRHAGVVDGGHALGWRRRPGAPRSPAARRRRGRRCRSPSRPRHPSRRSPAPGPAGRSRRARRAVSSAVAPLTGPPTITTPDAGVIWSGLTSSRLGRRADRRAPGWPPGCRRLVAPVGAGEDRPRQHRARQGVGAAGAAGHLDQRGQLVRRGCCGTSACSGSTQASARVTVEPTLAPAAVERGDRVLDHAAVGAGGDDDRDGLAGQACRPPPRATTALGPGVARGDALLRGGRARRAGRSCPAAAG